MKTYLIAIVLLLIGCARPDGSSSVDPQRSPASNTFNVGDCILLKTINFQMRVLYVSDSGYIVRYYNYDEHRFEWAPISNEKVTEYNPVKIKCNRPLKDRD